MTFTLSDFTVRGRKCCTLRGKRLIKVIVYVAFYMPTCTLGQHSARKYACLFENVQSIERKKIDWSIFQTFKKFLGHFIISHQRVYNKTHHALRRFASLERA
jgi:hypothetical protein